MKHGCRVCVTNRYVDEESNHVSLCGLMLTRSKGLSVADTDGVEGMREVTCPACLVAFDAWAETQREVA
jgi:hypothetical protein